MCSACRSVHEYAHHVSREIDVWNTMVGCRTGDTLISRVVTIGDWFEGRRVKGFV